MKLVFYTSLSISECIKRLESAVDPERSSLLSSLSFTGSKPVIGRIKNSSFRLHKRRSYRNSFAPVFYGTLRPSKEGTMIKGHFSMGPLVQILLPCSLAMVVGCEFLFVLFVYALSVIGVFWGDQWYRNPWEGVAPIVIIPLIGVLGILAVVLLARYLSRDEQNYLLAFLQETLDAEPEQ